MRRAAQTFRATWRGIALTIHWTRVWFAMEDGSYTIAHLEIMADDRAPLPITETGYKSHFTGAEAIDARGGPVAFTLAWLDHAARSPEWAERAAAARQSSLF